MWPQSLLPLLTLPFLASAHFKLVYPPARGFNEDTLPSGPCGGQSLTSNRTTVSMTSIPVALDMGHDQTAVQMLLGLGNDPGNNFNIIIHNTFGIQGLGNFCLANVAIPANIGLADGMNATLQVVTNGDGDGGLYNVSSAVFALCNRADRNLQSVQTSPSLQQANLHLHPAKMVQPPQLHHSRQQQPLSTPTRPHQ